MTPAILGLVYLAVLIFICVIVYRLAVRLVEAVETIAAKMDQK